MTKTLDLLLLEGIQNAAGVAQNGFLLSRFADLKEVMCFVDQTPEAQYAASELRKLFQVSNWALEPQRVERLFQISGELEFWALAAKANVLLERIPESSVPTPDFRLSAGQSAPCFEVKTPSVVNGWRALATMSENAFSAQFALQEQVNRGTKVAWSEQTFSPHGDVEHGKEFTAICHNLIDKCKGSIKRGQYGNAQTFLVLNFMLISGYYTGNIYLRPIAAGYPRDWSIHTGVLWTLAFGMTDQIVHGEPRFEGQPAIEGRLEREGLLIDPNHDVLAGIILIVHRLRETPIFYGLWRSQDYHRWNDSEPALCETLHRLVGSNWNDELDSNGWQLTSTH